MSKPEKLSLAVLLADCLVPAWQVRLIGQLSSIPDASICVLNANRGAARATLNRCFMYRLASKFDSEKRLERDRDAMRIVDIQSRPAALSSTRISFDLNRRADDLRDKLTNIDADAIVDLADCNGTDDSVLPDRTGVLRFVHGEKRCTFDTYGESVGLWETLGAQASLSSRVVLTCNNRIPNQYSMKTSSSVHKRSHVRTRNEHLWKLSDLPRRLIERVMLSDRPQSTEAIPAAVESSPTKIDTPATKRIGNSTLFWPVLRYASFRLVTKLRNLDSLHRWVILLANGANRTDFSNFAVLEPPDGLFWADPNVVEFDGETALLFEEADLDTGKGHLCAAPVSGNGIAGPARKIINRPYHMSYPFVFEWRGSLYMIPETAEDRSVQLHVCTSFPNHWKFVKNLLSNIEAYDATLFPHDGLWWMFVAVKGHPAQSSWDELYIYYADEPTSTEWQGHRLNPVVSDVYTARPAGPLFLSGNKLIRPSQDSSHHYGYALNFMEIVELTPDCYAEKLHKKFTPDWTASVTGIHTFASNRQYSVADAINCASRKRAQATRSND